MSQFGAKNAGAWARPPGGSSQLNPGLFQNTLIAGQPFAQMGMINAAAFSQQAANMNLNLLSAAQAVRVPQPAKKRTFSGVVTKMHDSYGFIDDDVFFQTSMVRGAVPRAGDRVMVEAAYNPSMPFKWNAHFVQLISDKNAGGDPPHAAPSSARNSRSTWAIPMDKPRPSPLAAENRGRPAVRSPLPARRRSPPRPVPVPEPIRRTSPPRRMSPPRPPARRSPPRRSPPRELRNALSCLSPKHNTPHRLMEPLQRKREHSTSTSVRTHSPTQKRDMIRDSISPPRRRARTIPRYQCYIPKVPVFGNGMPYTVIQLRRRYPSLYIPSDFTEAKFEWPIKTPIENPLSFPPSPVTFHIAHRDIDCPCPENEPLPVLNPPDSDYRYYTKVILMCHPGWSNLHQKAFGLLADGSVDESIEPLSLKRCLNFVVGTRGKDLMALGGAWSPSLDGPNPESDPQVLVRTAVRTVRALTGVDLSKCPKWYKMAELRYYRADKDRTDTCALLFPDTNGLMPSAESYEQLIAQLKQQLATKLATIDAQKMTLSSSVTADAAGADKESTTTAAAVASGEGDSTPTVAAQQGGDAVGKEQVEEMAEEDEDDEDLHPTHWSKLDIKAMKVAELRQELMARELETKGIKSVLCSRLQEAVDAEKAKEEGSEVKVEEEKFETVEEEKMDEKELTEEDKKAIEKFEKEKKDKKASLERHYNVSKEPGILVFPNRLAKGGKFDCKIVNLVTLLDYRLEDNKEHSFELGILAECISEMLDRAHAFAVYKTLCSAVDKETEKKRRRDAKIAEVLGVSEELDTSVVKEEPKDEEKTEMSEEEKKKEEENKHKEQEKKEEEERKALAEPRKPVVAERAIFQAFAHFDQNLCGYINEKDLEDVLFSIGINISRSQVQKLLKKFSSRDRINYRYMTESWISKDGTVSYKPGFMPDPPNADELLKGNVRKVEAETKAAVEEESKTSASETIIYNGAIMNIAHLLEQIAKAEADRNEAVQQLDVLEAQLKEGTRNVQMLEKKKKRLEEDVDKYRKRLHDAEKCLKNSVDDTVQMKTAIQDFRKMGERMIFVAEKLMPTTKDDKKGDKEKEKEVSKKEGSEGKEDKKFPKKKGSDETKPNGEIEEKKELQLVDEVSGADAGDETMDTEIVLSEEVTGDDEKEAKKTEHPETSENPVPGATEPPAITTAEASR